jgi:acetyl esterase/lipase
MDLILVFQAKAVISGQFIFTFLSFQFVFMKQDSTNINRSSVIPSAYALDPEIGHAMAAFLSMHPPGQQPEKGDWQMLRENSNEYYKNLNDSMPAHPEIITKDFLIATGVNTEIKLRWYSPASAIVKGSAVVYVHGGGRISGSVELYDRIVSDFVAKSGIPFLSVDYNLAPEVQGDSHAEEVFSAILWLKKHAVELGIDERRIAVMGDSAGGGLAAAAAILARDRNVHIARQILIYPMLDDRTLIPEEHLLPFAVWNYDNNYTGWKASLGIDPAGENISPISAPSRLIRFEGLPPAYISVGNLDIFQNENLAYAQQLGNAGVPIEFHLHPGAPHGFEFAAPDSAVAKRAMADHIRVIQSL